MSLWKELEDRIAWDFNIGDEFKKNMDGRYAFIIDIYEESVKLALYKMKKYSCESNPIKQQPPKEMILKAVQDKCTDYVRGGMYDIDEDLKTWIRKNYFGYSE
ncbi:MAG: DVU0772 family protein [Bacillota bacterium]